MLSDLIDSDKNELIENLKTNIDLQNEQCEKIISESENFLKGYLENLAAKNPKDILELINNEAKIKKDNNTVNNLISELSSDISSNLGTASEKADKASEILTLNIIKKISGKFSSREREINLEDLFSFIGLGSELKESVKASLRESNIKISDYPKRLF